MEKDFVTYEQAKELFDMGLRVPIAIRGYTCQYNEMILTDNVYDGLYTLEAPLKSQAFRWFREEYGLYPYIVFNIKNNLWISEWCKTNGNFQVLNSCETYEQAESICIDALIEMVKLSNSN